MTETSRGPAGSLRMSLLPTIGVWLIFLSWSLIRIPIPGVNEPHYLGKAKHWWNPAWCPGDFFLDSSNPHQFFYLTFGWCTQFLSLSACAVIGRAVALLILACGWQRMIQVISGHRWAGVMAAPVFLMLQSLGSFSGEWLVGGTEAKVPAYGFLFWAIGKFLSQHFLAAGLLAGLSVSFHPLVGVWGVVAGVLSTVTGIVLRSRKLGAGKSGATYALPLPTMKQTAAMGLLLGLSSLPGLIPAIQTIILDSSQYADVANQLQVGDRLAHHLDPMKFPKESFRYWGSLIVIWLLLQANLKRNPQQQWWRGFVISALLIAVAGVLIGSGPRPVSLMPGSVWRLKLLKFYFFRLGDLVVPVAASISAVRYGLLARDNAAHRFTANLKGVSLLLTCGAGALLIPFADANPSRLTPDQLSDWVAACRWIQDHSQVEDVTYSTDSGWALKWFAQRPEYVSYKDMPQDSASIVEWNRRLWVIANWRIAVTQDGEVTATELQDLRKQTGIRYLVCRRFGPMVPAPAFENATFRVYELAEPGK